MDSKEFAVLAGQFHFIFALARNLREDRPAVGLLPGRKRNRRVVVVVQTQQRGRQMSEKKMEMKKRKSDEMGTEFTRIPQKCAIVTDSRRAHLRPRRAGCVRPSLAGPTRL